MQSHSLNVKGYLALDLIMLATFSMDTHAVDFWKSVILDSLHYGFDYIFRCGFSRSIQCPLLHPARQQGNFQAGHAPQTAAFRTNPGCCHGCSRAEKQSGLAGGRATATGVIMCCNCQAGMKIVILIKRRDAGSPCRRMAMPWRRALFWGLPWLQSRGGN